MDLAEWKRPSTWSLPTRIIGALSTTFVIVAAALWLVWQPGTAPDGSATRAAWAASLPLEAAAGLEAAPARVTRSVSLREIYTSVLVIGVLLLLGAMWLGVRRQLLDFLVERRDALRAAAETETINSALLGALPDTIFLADCSGTFLDLRGSTTPGAIEAGGPPKLHETYRADVAQSILAAIRRAVDRNETQTVEYALEEPDGTRHFEARAAAYAGDKALVVVRDITDRLQAEQTIREAESKFRILVEQSLTGIYIIQDERFVYVNPRFADVFGYAPDELLRLDSVTDLLVPEDRSQVRERLEDGLSGRSESSHYTVRGIRSDSTVLSAEIYQSVIDYNGRPAIIGTLLDVTEQREAQEQLRVLGMAVEQSAEGVLVIDTAGIVCFVNPAWARMHGYTVSEVTGHHFRIFHTEEQLRREVFPVINRFEQTSIYRAEMGHKRKDGSTFMSSTAFASLRDDDGRVIGAVGICRDITEQKQYEAELLSAKEHAEELSRMKTAFLTNMSHEIRTPLTGILGFAKILEDELPSDLREFAHLIQVSGDRLMNTLNSILDLARLEAGEIQPVAHDVDLAEEILDAVTVFRALAREKDLDFDLCMDGDVIPARVDRNMLNIILNNLLGNAVKFTSRGEIGVRVSLEDGCVALAVTDTGVGIDPEFIPHLFDEFKQESDGLTRSHEGSGLGLSITKRLVSLMGGDISVDSAKGVGSCFVVTFPQFIDQPALSHVA